MNLPEIFHAVLRASCLGSAAVLLLLMMRRVAGRSLSPGARCWLWLPVAILFVMPRLPDLGLAWKETIPVEVTVHEWLDAKPLPNTTSLRPEPQTAAPAVEAPTTEARKGLSWKDWIARTWISIALALFGLWLLSYGWLFRSVRRGSKPFQKDCGFCWWTVRVRPACARRRVWW